MGTEITAAERAPAPRQPQTLNDISGSSEPAVEFDAAIEKSLVRKMDRRLVLLAFVCCMAKPPETLNVNMLTPQRRHGCLPRSVKHRQRPNGGYGEGFGVR